MSSHTGSEVKADRLDGSACSLAGCIALAAAAMAPALAVVLNAPAAAPSAGGALPLAFLIAFVASLLVGNTVATFARRLPPSAGSFYGFAAHGLGPAGGFAAGWLLAFGYAAFAPGLFTALGHFSSAYVRSRFGVDVPWWGLSLAGFTVVTAVALRAPALRCERNWSCWVWRWRSSSCSP